MGLVRPIAALLFIIALPVAFITTNVRIAVNEPRVYEYAIDQYDAPLATGIERDELLRASGELRDYFNNDADEISVRVRNSEGDLVPLFNRQEVLHLRDVKTLFAASFRVQEVAVLFCLAYVVAVFIWAREGSLRSLATQVLLSGLLTVAIVGGVGAVAMAGFESSFTQFHEIAFNNDFWRLDPATDRLIQMFPEAFWQDVSLWVGLGALAEMGVMSLVAAVYLGLTRGSTVRYALAQGVQA